MQQLTRRRPSTRAVAVGLACAWVLLVQPGAAEAQADSALVVILDASGSMKEAVEGGVKAELAPRGLLPTLERLPGDTRMSLRLLGEGSGGDDDECRASRQALPFGPFDSGAWRRAIGRVRWEGATPLTFTLRAALADLAAVDAVSKEVLIIGDGEETCGEDPVAVARAEAGGIRVHTISLGDRPSDQLAGIALVTGGSYAMAFDDTTFAAATEESLPAPEDLPEAAADGPGPVLEVILDVSNSMWGQVDGRVKMDLAREALAASLIELPLNVRVALRAYGHLTPFGDEAQSCQETELLIPPTEGGSAQVLAEASSLTPTGQTPIALSLRAAADDLAAAGGAGVVLLLTDGVESCGGDPTAVAAQIAASGLTFVLHTVGLGVDADSAAALRALATAGGGDYFDAPTATDLVSGVEQVVESASEFVMGGRALPSFPSPVARVDGGTSVETAAAVPPGYYSLNDHVAEKDWRYFAVTGTPGEAVEVRGLVCALAINLTRDGEWISQGQVEQVFYQGVTLAGDLLPRNRMRVRGEMGDWVTMTVPVEADGYARFRLGRDFGDVHRDTLFEIVP